MTTTIPTVLAPTVHARHLRAVLTHTDSVVVWLAPIGDVDVAHTGLTKAQLIAERDGIIRTLVTYDEAVDYLLAAQGDLATAAVIATAVVGRMHARGIL